MIYFTSDLHFGHANIIKYSERPFGSVDEMNEAIIANWNSVVTDDDQVYVLGDVALGKIKETLPLVQRLKGRSKILVPGNHDRCWTGHSKVCPADREMYVEAGFSVWHNKVLMGLGPIVDGHPTNWVNVCHFPYVGDSHGRDRYVEHRPKDDGKWLLHGHVHEAWHVRDRMINVGVDVNGFKPISEDEVLALMGVAVSSGSS